MAIKELFYDQRPQLLLDPRASQRIDPRFKFTRDSIGTYVDRDGLITTGAVGTPRFEYDPITGDERGLLIQPEATNLFTYSSGQNVSVWQKIRASITANAAVAPDGTTTADLIIPNSTINGYSRQFVNVTAGNSYTFSFFAKRQTEYDYISALISPQVPTEPFVWFNMQTGQVGTIIGTGVLGASIQAFRDSWYRCSVSYTAVSTVSTGFVIFPTKSDGSSNYTPGGGGVYIWGAQLEQSDGPTSYIATTSSQVTRAADLLSVESSLPSSGSVYIDARAISARENDTLLSLKNSSNDKIDLGFFSNAATYNSVALIANYDGTSKSSLPLPVPTTDRERNIITYGSQNYQYGSSTARFATSLSSLVPTDLNKLSIGHDSVDPNKAFNGYINSVYLWSGELTPAVAEALVRSELDPINADTFVPTGPAGSLSIVINTQGAAADGDKVFELPAESVANDNDIVITWGDQTESGLENAAAELGAPGLTKTYTAAGIYSIFVEGQLENLQFNNSSSAPDLLQIVRWGTTANGNDVFLSPSTMANAFYGCSQLDFSSVARTTSLPDTSAVANWTQAFYNCSSITGIFPQFNFSGATSFVRAWAGCSSITSFTAAGGQPQNVTQFFRAWDGCSGLTSFPLIDTSSGLSFNSAWQNCSSLTSFPAINTAASVGFNSTWRNCSSLTSFPLINTAFGIDFGFAWGGCSSLTSFPLINTSAGESFIGTWSNCSSLTSFPLINTSSGTSFASAWLGCSSLTSFPLIDTSNGTSFNSAWRDCIGLASFPLLNTSSGTDFARAWYVCVSLASFPAINTSAGTNFGQTWYANTSLTAFPSLDFDSATGSASDASTVLSGFYGAWLSCSNLANFPANLFNNTTCTRYLQAFQGCALTAASIENILVSINTANTSNGNLSLEGGTNAAQSTWTTAATNAYNALVGRGWTITFNP
jgi:hypothetical protein